MAENLEQEKLPTKPPVPEPPQRKRWEDLDPEDRDTPMRIFPGKDRGRWSLYGKLEKLGLDCKVDTDKGSIEFEIGPSLTAYEYSADGAPNLLPVGAKVTISEKDFVDDVKIADLRPDPAHYTYDKNGLTLSASTGVENELDEKLKIAIAITTIRRPDGTTIDLMSAKEPISDEQLAVFGGRIDSFPSKEALELGRKAYWEARKARVADLPVTLGRLPSSGPTPETGEAPLDRILSPEKKKMVGYLQRNIVESGGTLEISPDGTVIVNVPEHAAVFSYKNEEDLKGARLEGGAQRVEIGPSDVLSYEPTISWTFSEPQPLGLGGSLVKMEYKLQPYKVTRPDGTVLRLMLTPEYKMTSPDFRPDSKGIQVPSPEDITLRQLYEKAEQQNEVLRGTIGEILRLRKSLTSYLTGDRMKTVREIKRYGGKDPGINGQVEQALRLLLSEDDMLIWDALQDQDMES